MITEHLGSCDGSSTHVRDLAIMLTGMNHLVTIFAGDVDIDFVVPDSVAVHEMHEVSHRKRSVLHFAGGLCFLAQLLMRIRPDIVHVHHYYAAAMVFPVCRILGIPVLQSQHAFIAGRGILPLHSADRIVAMSGAIYNSIVETNFVRSGRLYAVPNGTSIKAERDQIARNDERPVRLLYAGRLNQQKGPHVLLEALHEIGNRLDYRCIIAGDGSLFNFISEKSLASLPNVDVMGSCRNMDFLYQWADICVFPFTSAEPFGLVTIEAGSWSRAVISTDMPYQNEIIRDGENGLLVPPGDAGALADAILRLGPDGREQLRLGQALRKTVAADYTLHIMTQRIMQHYYCIMNMS